MTTPAVFPSRQPRSGCRRERKSADGRPQEVFRDTRRTYLDGRSPPVGAPWPGPRRRTRTSRRDGGIRPDLRRFPARAAGDGWLAGLRPAGARRLALALVIDTGSSMVLWRDTVRELGTMLRSAGVFRDVRSWWLDTDTRSGEAFLLRAQEEPGPSAAH